MRQPHDAGWPGAATQVLAFVPRLVPPLAAVMVAIWCWAALPWNYSGDDAEPEVLNIAWRFARGEPIYRGTDTPPYAFAVYPPVYYATVGWMLKHTGLSFTPARLMSLGASIATALAVLRLHREWNGRTAGVWPAFFLALVPATFFNIARCHPEMLALAFASWSLVGLLRNRPFATLVMSPILNAAAFYTKQTYVALPIAACIYFALHNRRWVWTYVAVSFLTLGVPFLILQWGTHGQFALDTVVLAQLPYRLSQIVHEIYSELGPVVFLLALVLVQLSVRVRQRAWELLDVYTVVLFVLTLSLLGRAGASSQYVVALVVLSLLYAIRHKELPSPKACCWVIQVQLVFLLLYTPWHFLARHAAAALRERRSVAEIYRVLARSHGPVLSQQGSFALFSRGYIAIQLFHFSNLTRMGKWNPEPLLKDVDEREYGYVITKFPLEGELTSASGGRFTPELVAALRRSYEHAQSFEGYYLYRPRY